MTGVTRSPSGGEEWRVAGSPRTGCCPPAAGGPWGVRRAAWPPRGREQGDAGRRNLPASPPPRKSCKVNSICWSEYRETRFPRHSPGERAQSSSRGCGETGFPHIPPAGRTFVHPGGVPPDGMDGCNRNRGNRVPPTPARVVRCGHGRGFYAHALVWKVVDASCAYAVSCAPAAHLPLLDAPPPMADRPVCAGRRPRRGRGGRH